MAETDLERGDVIWAPSAERARASRLTEFARFAAEHGLVPEERIVSGLDYAALQRASVEDLAGFWSCLAQFFGVELGTDGPSSASPPLASERMPGTEWFPGSTVSYVGHLARQWRPEQIAIVATDEGAEGIREVKWGELNAMAGAVAAELRNRGVGRGDRVGGYLPNVPETVAAFLATAAVGATWVSCSPDFGAAAVGDRLEQVAPKVLFAVDGYRWAGREFDRSAVVAEIGRRLGPETEIVRLPYLGLTPAPGYSCEWDDFLANGAGGALDPIAVPFEHPLWVLFSSGTTGLPKGLVHSQGGILLEHLKWLGLQSDLGPGDRLLWLTTTGWTMWNFVVGGLLTGTTIVLYEGNPAHPGLETIWSLADRADVSCLGAGAGFFHACMSAGLRPGAEHDLSALEALGSTGSPLLPEAFDWIYEHVDHDVWLFSTSGGTDICSAFVGGSPWLPVRRGELQAPALGVDVQAWDPDGRQLGPGKLGELVVTKPMPSMPVRLLGDDETMGRYRDAYFDVYPGVWRHGDWIEMTNSGGAVIHGRSDATINRGGVRIGTAEIYRALIGFDAVEDATVVESPAPAEAGALSEILLFVQPAEGTALDDGLVASIRDRIRESCSPRHVPDRVIACPAIPRTLTGKVIETPIKRLLEGLSVESSLSRDSLADPASIDWFRTFAAAWRAEWRESLDVDTSE